VAARSIDFEAQVLELLKQMGSIEDFLSGSSFILIGIKGVIKPWTYHIAPSAPGAPYFIEVDIPVLSVESHYGLINVETGYYASPLDVPATKRYGMEACTTGFTCTGAVRTATATFQTSICENNAETLSISENAAFTSTKDFSLTATITGMTHSLTTVDDPPETSPFTLSNVGRIESTALDYEAWKEYTLLLKYQVDGDPIEYVLCYISVAVVNVNESPSITNAGETRTINENMPGGTLVANTIQVDDPDLYDEFKFTITSGDSGLFMIDCSGTIMTKNVLDFESVSSYSLVVQVADAAGLTDTETVVVSVVDMPEPPSCTSTTFNVNEDVAVDSQVATFKDSAADPDLDDVTKLPSNPRQTFMLKRVVL